MFLQGGIWGAAAEAVTRVFSWACNKIKEDAERAAKRAARAFAEGLDEIRKSAAVVEKAFESSVSGIEKSISRFDAMTNSVKELTKAEIELAKQRAISNGMDAASANAAAEDLSAQVDFEAEELRLRNVIALEQKRVDAAKAAEAATAEEVRKATEAKAAAEAEYQKKRKAAAEKAATEALCCQPLHVRRARDGRGHCAGEGPRGRKIRRKRRGVGGAGESPQGAGRIGRHQDGREGTRGRATTSSRGSGASLRTRPGFSCACSRRTARTTT